MTTPCSWIFLLALLLPGFCSRHFTLLIRLWPPFSLLYSKCLSYTSFAFHLKYEWLPKAFSDISQLNMASPIYQPLVCSFFTFPDKNFFFFFFIPLEQFVNYWGQRLQLIFFRKCFAHSRCSIFFLELNILQGLKTLTTPRTLSHTNLDHSST